MKVLCLAGDRTVAYLIKHVLVFEGFAVEICRSVSTLAEGLADGAEVIVAADPLPTSLPGASVVAAPDPFDADRLVTGVRRAVGRAVAGRVKREVAPADPEVPADEGAAGDAPVETPAEAV